MNLKSSQISGDGISGLGSRVDGCARTGGFGLSSPRQVGYFMFGTETGARSGVLAPDVI